MIEKIEMQKSIGLILSGVLAILPFTMAAAQGRTAGEHKRPKPIQAQTSPFDNFGEAEDEIERLDKNIARLYDAGQYDAAIPEARTYVALIKKEYGEKHKKYANALNTLGWLLQASRQYERARELFEQSLLIQESILGTDAPELTTALNNLANLLEYQGDYDAAIPLLVRAEHIIEKSVQDQNSSPALAQAMNSLAVAYSQIGQADKARALLDRSYAIYESAGLEKDLDLAQDMSSLAMLYREQDRKKAIGLLQQCLQIREKYLGNDHPDVAETLNNLARIEALNGEYDEAMQQLARAAAIQKKVLGSLHPDLAYTLNNMGIVALQSKRTNEAKVYFLSAADIIGHHVETVLPSLSFAEQQLFLATQLPNETSFLLSSCRDGDSLNAAYNHLLRWKGLLIETLRWQSMIGRLAREQEASEVLDQLATVRAETTRWFHTAGTIAFERWQARGEELSRKKEALERSLAKLGRSGKIGDTLKSDSLKQILAVLRPDETLVDLYRFSDLNDMDRSSQDYCEHYAAVISDAQANLKLADLGRATQLDDVWADWYQTVREKKNALEQWTKLKEALWTPIAASIKTQSKAFVSTDSNLALLPWELFWGLQEKKGMVITQLDSPRELVNLRRMLSSALPQDPVLLAAGGVNFASRAQFLPASLQEAKTIAALAEQEHLKVMLLTGKEPTRQAILNRLPAANYIHLATHGYFVTENQAVELARKRQMLGKLAADARLRQGRNPLVGSGLILAASDQKSGSDKNNILTAEDLIGIDLNSCRNITLSACNTGLGVEQKGQGVLGLRASIMAAGARSILMSLWPVSDYATMKLMQKFYEGIWQKKLSGAEALRQAQQALREDSYDRFKLPIDWAAWVIVGEAW